MHGFDEFSSGDSLGKYRIVRELGRGGMGVVYLAEDTQLQRDIALKLLNPWLNSDQDFVDRFRVEARSIARMLHPNIIHVNSFDSLEGHLLIDMEYVDGFDLQHYLAAQALSVPRVTCIAADILTGLCVCHDAHVIHRDIKPSNILVNRDARAKLGDFGIATAYAAHMEAAISRTSSSGFCLGTPRYAPPELWEGATPTPAWDLYAVGMVMYEALAGKPAYEAKNPFAFIRQIDSRPVPRLDEVTPAISRELADLVQSLLRRDPGERPVCAAEALSTLRSVPEFPSAGEVTELPTLRVPKSAIASLSTRRKRRATLKRAGLTLIAAGFVLALVYLFPPLYRSHLLSRHNATPAPLFQDQVQQSAAPSKDVLLQCFKSKAGPEYWVFDAVLLDTAEGLQDSAEKTELTWMIEAPRPGRDSTIYAATDRSLWVLRMPQGKDQQLALEGNWAEFRDDAATVFHQGGIIGTGLWSVPNEQLTASLTFRDGSDSSTRSGTLSATRRRDLSSDTAFVYRMEQAALVQPLLYHELLPRRYTWAKRAETLFPSITGASLVAAFVKDDAHELKVDGKLTETFWTGLTSSSDAKAAECKGVPYDRSAMMLARCFDDGLLLGLSAPLQSNAPLSVELAVMPGIAAPIDQSPYVIARKSSSGSLAGRIVVRGIELHWDSDWQIADSIEDGTWHAEILIPFAGMAKLRGGPTTDPWRLNCEVTRAQRDGKHDLLVRWGFPGVSEVVHGVKIAVAAPATPLAPAKESSGPQTTEQTKGVS
ncbi:MAG: serine/threonine protein kinase [Candidatus Hydrogenedentes bacterium]|nr:serine/threonine protein kinase [Candidatus Hydrogenedentota bacterium]